MIPFTREAFLGVFERYNLDVWPMQVVLVGVAVAILVAARRGTPGASRAATAGTTALWLWMAVMYHWRYFTAINPAAWAFGALFLVQAGLLVQSAASGALRFQACGGARAWLGGAIIGYGLVIYPVLSQLGDHPFPRSPTFGLPCPTTIFTLGLLLGMTLHLPRRLLVLPVLWAALGSTAAFSFGIWEDLGLGASAILTVLALASERRPAAQRT